MELLPAARQAYFSQPVAVLKRIVPAVWAFGALVATYEGVRAIYVGVDALRVLVVCLPMGVVLLVAGVVKPVLNYRDYKRLVRRYEFNATEQHWTLTLLHNAHRQVVVREPPTGGQVVFFGKEYPATVFTQQQRTWYFPLAPVILSSCLLHLGLG